MNHDSRILSALILSSGLLLLTTASGHLHSPDCEINFRTARSIAEGNGFAIEPMPDGFGTRRGIDGKEYPQYGPLQPVLAAFLYAVSREAAGSIPETWLEPQRERLSRTVLFYRPMGDFPGIHPQDHFQRVARLAVSLFNPLVTWLTVILLAVWARKTFGDAGGWVLLPIVYLLGTIAWPHSRPFYSESAATLFLLASGFLADGLKPALTPHQALRAAAIGGAAGCALLTRVDSVVALPGVALLALGRIFFSTEQGRAGTRMALTAIGVLALVVTASIQLGLNVRWYGGPFATGYSDQPEGVSFNIPFLESLWIYLLSPGKSIFWYSPPLLVSLALFGSFWKRDRLLAGSMAAIALGYLLVVGRWQNLGGWCWGPRHLVQMTPFLLFPLPLLVSTAMSSQYRRYWVSAFGITLVWGGAVQFTGVLVDYMWPLDQTLRGLPSGADSEVVISTYSPLLHLHAWSRDREADWLLVDLWKSGSASARALAGTVWALLLAASGALGWALWTKRRETHDGRS